MNFGQGEYAKKYTLLECLMYFLMIIIFHGVSDALPTLISLFTIIIFSLILTGMIIVILVNSKKVKKNYFSTAEDKEKDKRHSLMLRLDKRSKSLFIISNIPLIIVWGTSYYLIIQLIFLGIFFLLFILAFISDSIYSTKSEAYYYQKVFWKN